VHRQQLFTISTPNQQLLLQQLKWPVEYLFIGLKNRDYFAPSDTSLLRKNLDVWDKYSVYTDNTYTLGGFQANKVYNLTTLVAGETLGVASATFSTTGTAHAAVAVPTGSRLVINGQYFTYTGPALAAGDLLMNLVANTVSPAPSADIVASAPIAAAAKLLVAQGAELSAKTWVPSLTNINIAAHGIDIYKNFPANFFNAYTTYNYGGPNINAPTDVGSLFVPFCLYPGTYQPSGHINISRAREFYLEYTAPLFDSSLVSPLVGLLVIIASAIKFVAVCIKVHASLRFQLRQHC
jgi:hypothetical protein